MVTKNSVEITHPDKIYFPKDKLTKQDLVNYYDEIADFILPYLKDRPENLHRFPNGIHEDGFYQKDNHDLPKWIKTKQILSESTGEKVNYLLCQDKQTLLYLINLGCIELNPWSSRVSQLDKPDYLILDLDPEDIDFKKVVETAQAIKALLNELKIKGYPKTSGATGIHIYLPTGGKYTYEQVHELAKLLAQVVNQRTEKFTSLERSPADRQKKVYIDYVQNNFGQTIASAYSARPKDGATVSTPLKWEEVNDKLSPKNFTIENMPERLKKVGDLWKPTTKGELDLPKIMNQLLEKLS